MVDRLQAVSSGPADYEKNPGIGVGAEDQVGVVGLDQLHEVGEDLPLGSFQPPLAAIEDLYAGDIPGHGRVAGCLQLQSGQRDLEFGREPGFVPISAGEEVVFGHVALILADVHVAELGLVDNFGGQPPAPCALIRGGIPGSARPGGGKRQNAGSRMDKVCGSRLAEIARRVLS
jgi:hypothetical protein